MNERIQELSDQADAFAEGNVQYYRTAHDEYYPQFYEVSRKKFAELIVKECIAQLEIQRNHYADPGAWAGDSRYYERMDAKESCIEDAIGSLKYYFGVE